MALIRWLIRPRSADLKRSVSHISIRGRGTRGPGYIGEPRPVMGVRAAIAGIALITCVVGGLGLTIAELRRVR